MAKVLLGLGGLLSDPACCLIRDGKLVAAVEQVKLTRLHPPGSFPEEAVRTVLEIAGVQRQDINCVALARPFASGAESAAQLALRAQFPQSQIVVVDHHDAHAASAFYLSPFEQAHVLSVDRAGDFRSAVLYEGDGRQLRRMREMYFPDSLGDLFNRVTELLGFEPRADEHKVQWLSASGTERFGSLFDKLLNVQGDGWPQFDRSYYDADRLTGGGFSSKFYEEIGAAPRDLLPAQLKADLATSLQRAVERAVISMLGQAENVAIAGGVAMNAFLVRALEQRFTKAFVQPAAGNDGTSLGAAVWAWHNVWGESQRVAFQTLCLGPEFAVAEIKQILENCKLRFSFLITEDEVVRQAIRALNENKIVAWMQGRMEFGPRALGNRSILASPLNPYSSENLNVFIKHREGFRKFAASVPEELASEYFRVGQNSCYLATVGAVQPRYREQFAAALLGEDAIRVHTVSRKENPLFHELLIETGRATGLPVLYNTSFNLFGDPMVCTPRDAVKSFYSSGVDALFAGSFYLEK